MTQSFGGGVYEPPGNIENAASDIKFSTAPGDPSADISFTTGDGTGANGAGDIILETGANAILNKGNINLRTGGAGSVNIFDNEFNVLKFFKNFPSETGFTGFSAGLGIDTVGSSPITIKTDDNSSIKTGYIEVVTGDQGSNLDSGGIAILSGDVSDNGADPGVAIFGSGLRPNNQRGNVEIKGAQVDIANRPFDDFSAFSFRLSGQNTPTVGPTPASALINFDQGFIFKSADFVDLAGITNPVTIESGSGIFDSVLQNTSSGNVLVASGDVTGTGNSGNVKLFTSLAPSGIRGDIQFEGNRVDASTSVGPFRAPNLSADPASPQNGDIWYNTTTNELKGHANGSTQVILS